MAQQALRSDVLPEAFPTLVGATSARKNALKVFPEVVSLATVAFRKFPGTIQTKDGSSSKPQHRNDWSTMSYCSRGTPPVLHEARTPMDNQCHRGSISEAVMMYGCPELPRRQLHSHLRAGESRCAMPSSAARHMVRTTTRRSPVRAAHSSIFSLPSSGTTSCRRTHSMP
jgi:hypothetical protein